MARPFLPCHLAMPPPARTQVQDGFTLALTGDGTGYFLSLPPELQQVGRLAEAGRGGFTCHQMSFVMQLACTIAYESV